MEKLESCSVNTEWIKINDIKNGCFVGNDAIAFNLGSHILFASLSSGQETFYRCSDVSNGDGVSCLAGHKVFPMFAFAESCWNAKIFIVSYPEFNKISTLESKEESIYISLAFSETEHLIALTGMPSYNIQVWYWRTNDMLISKNTDLITDKQRITCSSSLPLTVAQFAHTTGKLIVWEVHGTQKFCKLIKRNIHLGFQKVDAPFQEVYSIEGNIQIVNKHGDIYYVIPSSGSVNLIAKWNGATGDNNSCIAFIRNGILVSGPDGTLKYFKRQKYVWNEIFQVTTSDAIIMLKGHHDNDSVIGTSVNGGLYKIILSDGDKINISSVKTYDPPYDYFTLIYPIGDYMVAVDEAKDIHVLSVGTGTSVAKLSISNQTVVRTNPCYPFVAIGNGTGDVKFISLLEPERPKDLVEFLLSRRPIVNIQFSDLGHFLVAQDEDFNFFVLRSVPGEKMFILHHFKETINFVEFLIIESKIKLDIMFLCAANVGSTVGDLLLKIIVPLDDVENSERMELQLPTQYTNIMSMIGAAEKFYAIPYGVKHVEVLEILNDSIVISDVIQTPNKLRHIEGYVDEHHLVTWSIDGIVTAYDVKTNHKQLMTFAANNRQKYGTKIARCCAKCELVVTLDQSGNIFCSKLGNVKKTQSEDEDESLVRVKERMARMFYLPTSGGFPGISLEQRGKKFTDLKSEQTYQMEARESEQTRNLLFSQLDNLRLQVKKMLDENEKLPEDEKLEVQDFNLDLITTEQKETEARQEREQAEKKMMDFIGAQSTMNTWIVDKCWNPMDVKGAKVRGMFINLFVDNYPLLAENQEKEMQRIKLIRAIENSVARQDAFLPWRPIPTIQLEKILATEPGMFELDTTDTTQFQKIICPLMGTNTYKKIEISPIHYQQIDVVTFHQMRIEQFLIHLELIELKKAFNEKFDAMHRTKEFQIHSIRFKNNRLRHIQSETRSLDELKGLRLESLQQILDPDFQPDEIPDTVVNVIESEVCVSPYISPSYKKMLEEQEAARERRRKELEADDFRDRALDVMMDGVLEHKWEDEIKKNPKKPDCLIKNKPREDWTELEVRDVDEYNQNIKQIQAERDKYRRLLYEEQKLLQGLLDEEIQKFNFGLCGLMMEKLSMDMIVGQEEMKMLLVTRYNFKRIYNQKKEIAMRQNMERVKSLIENLSQLQTELQDWIKDIKTNYENLQSKDKTLEKQFKANFNEAAPGAPVDQAFKYFKRRPKLQMRAQITSPILLEVAKRVASKKMSHHVKLLPSECVEYLHGVDLLDQVSSSTTGIDANSWQILCKMRRIKIESEFKIKSLGLQLADAEATLSAFSREINNKRNHFQSIERSLVELKENRETDLINRYVQLVMQRGLIEISLTGSFADFKDSILIHRSDVDDINEIIIKAGMKKLRALENSAMFRRKITMKEWEHKVLKLKVRDLKEFVKTIEKCKITKEVQLWLKKKERGWAEDLSSESLNRHIENSINAQEKVLSDIVKEITNLEKRIDIKKKEIKEYDDEIQMLNIDVSEQTLMRDIEFEREEIKLAKERMLIIIERAKLVRHIQYQHSHLLQLTTLLELQRLKTYPTLTQTHGGRYQKSV